MSEKFQLKGGISELDFGYTKLCEIAAIYIEKVNIC